MPNSQRITMRLYPNYQHSYVLNKSIFIERGLIPNSQRITTPHFAKHYISIFIDNKIHYISLELRSPLQKTTSSTLLRSMQSWKTGSWGYYYQRRKYYCYWKAVFPRLRQELRREIVRVVIRVSSSSGRDPRNDTLSTRR